MHKNKRDAKRILRDLHHVLPHIEAQFLPQVAKLLAQKFCVPQKVMLKGMASYIRVHHTKGESNA